LAGDRIYRRISIARPAERDARGGGRSGEVNDDTLERKRQAKEGRKKRGRAKTEATTTTEGKRRQRRRRKRILTTRIGLDWIVGCFLFLANYHFAFQRMIQTYIMPLVSKKYIY
jgi:hypothetical protein